MWKKGVKFATHPVLLSLVLGFASFKFVEHLIYESDRLTVLDGSLLNEVLMQRQRLQCSRNIVLLSIEIEEEEALRSSAPYKGLLLDVALIDALEAAGARVAFLDFEYWDSKDGADRLKHRLANLQTMAVTVANHYVKLPEGKTVEIKELQYNDLSKIIPRSNRVRFANDELVKPVTGPVFLYVGMDLLVDPLVPGVALSAAQQYLALNESFEYDSGRSAVTAGTIELPVAEDGSAMLQYPVRGASFAERNVVEFLKMSPAKRREFVGDKMVVVGQKSEEDLHTSPEGEQFGYRMWAYAINSILSAPAGKAAWLTASQEIGANVLVGALAALLGFMKARKRMWVLLPFVALLVWYLPVFAVISAGKVVSGMSLMGTFLGSALISLAAYPALSRLWTSLSDAKAATAMFLDIRQSTELIAKLGSEGYGEIFNKVLNVCNSRVQQFQGVIERPIGDAALIVFETDANGKHAERALDCALALLPDIQKLGIQVGIGIESGVLTGRYVVEGDSRVWSSFGEPINAAQRLQDVARELNRPIAIGSGAASQLAGRADIAFLGTRTLRGFSSPVGIYHVSNSTEKQQ